MIKERFCLCFRCLVTKEERSKAGTTLFLPAETSQGKNMGRVSLAVSAQYFSRERPLLVIQDVI